MSTKTCRRCGDTKNTSEFYCKAAHKDLLHSHCKDCIKDNSLKHYALSPEQYQLLWDKQHGLCAICRIKGSKQNGRRLAVDHNHSTGEIRGLLCAGCNAALGMINENLDTAKRLQDYISVHGKASITRTTFIPISLVNTIEDYQ